MKQIKVTNDFETQSYLDVKVVGAYELSMHPTTKVTCYAIKIEGNKHIWQFEYEDMQRHYKHLPLMFRMTWEKAIINSQFVFSAHNAYFEQCIYNNILVKRLGWPSIPQTKWRCTAAKARACALPGKLERAAEVLKLRSQKDMTGHRAMLRTAKPTPQYKAWEKKGKIGKAPPMFITPESHPEVYEKTYAYNKIDIITEEELDLLLPDLTSDEQKVWFHDQLINLRGVNIDRPLVEKIYGLIQDELALMRNRLSKITEGEIVTGNERARILKFLSDRGEKLPDLKSATVDNYLKTGDKKTIAYKILKLRKGLSKSSNTKYKKLLDRSAFDGRLRDLLLYHSASTGRWGGVGVQPQNLPRGMKGLDIFEAIDNIKKYDAEVLKVFYGEDLMPVFSSVIRGMFIPSEGHTMFVEDWSAIECRVLWWLAGHKKGLEMFISGIDPYTAMAAIIFDKPATEINDHERQVGKAAVLGCGYQMGWKKYIISAKDVYRVDVTKEVAKKAVQSYRKEHWPVKELWDNYTKAAIHAVETPGVNYPVGPITFRYSRKTKFLKVTLPSGRKLSYYQPQVKWIDVVVKPDEDDIIAWKKAVREGRNVKKPETKTFRTQSLSYYGVNSKNKNLWTREHIYGGKWAENIVQAVSRDILSDAALRAELKNFFVLWHAHDELICEAPNGKYKLTWDEKKNLHSPTFRKILETVPAWAEGLPLKASGWAGNRYKKG